MIEILMIRDPDASTDITVWLDGEDVTNECVVVDVDAGAGYSFDDWCESAVAAHDRMTSRTAREAVMQAYADPPGRGYIDGFPGEDE